MQMSKISIRRGDRELDRFDGLSVSFDQAILLEVSKQATERLKQETERLRLRGRLVKLAIVVVFFGGTLALGLDGLIAVKNLLAEVLK